MLEGERASERSTLVREAMRLIIEEALEAYVAEELGRRYYDRGERLGGYRNGYQLGRLGQRRRSH